MKKTSSLSLSLSRPVFPFRPTFRAREDLFGPVNRIHRIRHHVSSNRHDPSKHYSYSLDIPFRFRLSVYNTGQSLYRSPVPDDFCFSVIIVYRVLRVEKRRGRKKKERIYIRGRKKTGMRREENSSSNYYSLVPLACDEKKEGGGRGKKRKRGYYLTRKRRDNDTQTHEHCNCAFSPSAQGRKT